VACAFSAAFPQVGVGPVIPESWWGDAEPSDIDPVLGVAAWIAAHMGGYVW
jgi:hypothetical protein